MHSCSFSILLDQINPYADYAKDPSAHLFKLNANAKEVQINQSQPVSLFISAVMCSKYFPTHFQRYNHPIIREIIYAATPPRPPRSALVSVALCASSVVGAVSC